MMKKYETIYQKLKEQFSDAEIAEGYMIPADMTEEEKKASNEEIRNYRFQRLKERTEEQRLLSEIMRLRFLMEEYVEKEEYDEQHNFGFFLDEYVKILRKNKKELAGDLNLHHTKLSRLISGMDDPNVDVIYRLEEHSGKLISAVLWWQLLAKKQEYTVRTDQNKRRMEALKVRNALKFRA